MYIPSGCRTLVSVKVLESFSVLSFVLTKFPSQILTIWRVSRGTYYNSTTKRSGHSRTENLGTIDFHVTQGYFMGGQNKFIRIYLSSLDQFGRSKQIHTNLFIIPRPIFPCALSNSGGSKINSYEFIYPYTKEFGRFQNKFIQICSSLDRDPGAVKNK